MLIMLIIMIEIMIMIVTILLLIISRNTKRNHKHNHQQDHNHKLKASSNAVTRVSNRATGHSCVPTPCEPSPAMEVETGKQFEVGPGNWFVHCKHCEAETHIALVAAHEGEADPKSALKCLSRLSCQA